MKLKNKDINFNLNILKIKLTKKSLFAFLLSFSIVSVIIGILFYFYLNKNDQELIKSNVLNYFTLSSSYNYYKIFKESLFNITFNIILIWILGISIIGLFVVFFLFFSEFFSTGFTMAAIINTYKLKGILGIFTYLFPTRVIYLILFFIISFYAIKISYKLIMLLFLKKDVNIHLEFKYYFKILIISIIVGIIYSILEIFITPFMIKLFTFITK